METSIIGIKTTYNGQEGLFIERLHHHTYGPNHLKAVGAAQWATTLEPGWEWMPLGMNTRPALKSIAKVADPDGKIVCTPEILDEAIAFAKECGEDALAAYLETSK